ncbi:MAG: glycerol kinase GlpK [Bacteroidetes bacterium]|jgi:glycerol kinase|nr:MAG: glycerol kinase [Cryomorphaceae bacterium BACL29 MAG-121220-bin8]MDA0757739.1 glycerol kinase GlpK [Bacteroidota bacterium]MDA1019574.1 glycerol kinase GlpK [Bacteroidota bacterium]
MKKYILAIDAGTTSSRAILFDKKGAQVAISQFEFTQIFPKESWVEHNPMEIWETQLKAIKEVVSKANIEVDEIDSIGITNQRETTVIWNKNTGKPVYNAIVWQDRRTAFICNELNDSGKANVFYEKTGLLLDAYFSGTKIKWILDSDPKIRQAANDGELLFGTVDTWLIWNLTNRAIHATDCTNASRTLLFNIHTLKWDDELLDILKIPIRILPNVFDSSQKIGCTHSDILGKEIPICGIAGDQQAALFGQMCLEPGDVKNTYGTGCFCMMNTGNIPVKSNNRMLTTIGWKIGNDTVYALEGSVFIAGAIVQWLRDQLNIIKNASEIEDLANTVEDNGGVTFISALAGLGAPYWNPDATGAIMGITRGTQKGHIARAALEAIALRSREIIIEMQKDSGTTFHNLKVDGGASNNNLLMQIQSNLLQANVIRPKVTETTALGVAFFAGLASGFWNSIEDIKGIWEIEKKFNPQVLEKDKMVISNWENRIKKVL